MLAYGLRSYGSLTHNCYAALHMYHTLDYIKIVYVHKPYYLLHLSSI